MDSSRRAAAEASASHPGSASQFAATERRRAEIIDWSAIEPVDCPCGQARRALAERDDFPGTLHLTDIEEDARTHYHREHTETYIVLECQAGAAIELDGEPVAVQPYSAVLIPPGVRHRAVGRMRVAIVCTPNFDAADEYFD